MNSRVGPRLTELFSSHQYLRLLFAEYTQCLPLSLFSTAVASQHVSTPDNPFIQLSSHSELKLFALINWRGSREAQGLETTDGLRCGADVTAHCICIALQRPPAPSNRVALLTVGTLPSSSIFPPLFPPLYTFHQTSTYNSSPS